MEPERDGTCDRQVMEVINRADPIFDTYMRPHNLSIESAWVRAVSEIFDNKNCHTAPPAHLLTRTPHTSCPKNLDHCLEL